MALATTTLAAAVTASATTITVASATSIAANRLVIIDSERMYVAANYVSGTTVPVLRGRDGTATAAHVITANVIHGLASDFPVPAAGVSDATLQTAQVSVALTSLTASGAIAFVANVQQQTFVLNGTSVVAATLANPTTDMDGILLIIVGNGKAAHTVTYTAGLGNIGGTADVITFHASGSQGILLIACGGFWTGLGMVAGAASVAGAGIG